MSGYVEIADDRGNLQHVPIPAQGSGWAGDDRRQAGQLARSEAGRTAGAVAAGNLMTSFLGDGATSQVAAENAARMINELGEGLASSDYAPNAIQPPVTQTQSGLVVVQEPQQVVEQPTDYELPAEYAFLNDDEPEADDDDLAPEPAAAQDDPVVLDDEDLADPRIRQLHEQAVKAQKQADHEKSLRLKASRPQWEAEAQRVFRLGEIELLDADDLKSIRAGSHREFLRQAKAIADRNKKAALRFAPAQAQPAPQIVTREQQQRDPRSWGDPPAGAPPADLSDNNREARIAKARQTGKLANVLREMISP